MITLIVIAILLTIIAFWMYRSLHYGKYWESEFIDFNDNYHIIKRACDSMQKNKKGGRK